MNNGVAEGVASDSHDTNAGADVTIVSSNLIIVFHTILRVAGTYRDVRTSPPKFLAVKLPQFQSRGEGRLRPLRRVVSTKIFHMPAPLNTNIHSWKIQLGH